MFDDTNGNIINFKKSKHGLISKYYGGMKYPDLELCNYRNANCEIIIPKIRKKVVRNIASHINQFMKYFRIEEIEKNKLLLMDSIGIKHEDYTWDKEEESWYGGKYFYL